VVAVNDKTHVEYPTRTNKSGVYNIVGCHRLLHGARGFREVPDGHQNAFVLEAGRWPYHVKLETLKNIQGGETIVTDVNRSSRPTRPPYATSSPRRPSSSSR